LTGKKCWGKQKRQETKNALNKNQEERLFLTGGGHRKGKGADQSKRKLLITKFIKPLKHKQHSTKLRAVSQEGRRKSLWKKIEKKTYLGIKELEEKAGRKAFPQGKGEGRASFTRIN